MVLVESELYPPVVSIWSRIDDAARAAAECAADGISAAIRARGYARVLFASAPSQEAMLARLGADPRVDWSRVRSFHLDDYVGLGSTAPQAFGQWLQDRLPADALRGFSRIRAANDVVAEVERYSALVTEAAIDVTCMGLGVNGHIAFNEPGVSSLSDSNIMRQVDLDAASRQQQVDEGLFNALDHVPRSALTLTVPAVIGARSLVVTVLGEHKAAAVAQALEGPVTVACPGSLLQAHPNASWFLDDEAAKGLTEDWS